MVDSTYPVHIPFSDNASFLLHDPIGYGQSYYRGKRTSSPERKLRYRSSGRTGDRNSTKRK